MQTKFKAVVLFAVASIEIHLVSLINNEFDKYDPQPPINEQNGRI